MKQSYYLEIYYHNEKVINRKGEIIRLFSKDDDLNEEIGESITYLKKGVMRVPEQLPVSIAEQLIKKKRAKIISSNKAKEADLLKRLRYVTYLTDRGHKLHLSDNDRFKVFLKMCPEPSKQEDIEGEFIPFTDEQINQAVQDYVKNEQKNAQIKDSKTRGIYYTLNPKKEKQLKKEEKNKINFSI